MYFLFNIQQIHVHFTPCIYSIYRPGHMRSRNSIKKTIVYSTRRNILKKASINHTATVGAFIKIGPFAHWALHPGTSVKSHVIGVT